MKLFLRLFFLCGVMGWLACGKLNETSQNAESQCVLPSDQAGTILGHWTKIPVPLAFRRGDFSADEKVALTSAATAWNQFFLKSKKVKVLDFGPEEAPYEINQITTAAQLCNEPIFDGANYSGYVVIAKQAQKWPYDASVIALTSTCPLPGSPYKKFYASMMELNYQHFFKVGSKQPDLQSIFLHELGHMIGLNHSCEDKGKEGMPSCQESGINPDYTAAVLFPTILFPDGVNGEQRRILRKNDQGRANCLY